MLKQTGHGSSTGSRELGQPTRSALPCARFTPFATLAPFACSALLLACNALDEPAKEEGARTIIPTDSRAATEALTAPPISGGTLAASPDGRWAVAADPDRARVSIVDMVDGSVRHVVLAADDEPGRVVTDARGFAYVALRRAGDVIAVRLQTAVLEQRVHACSAARGLALQNDVLHLACADGQLVSLQAAAGDDARDAPSLSVLRQLVLGSGADSDLRDVVVRGDHLLVSTFKQAGLIEVDAQGVPAQPLHPQHYLTLVNQTVEEKIGDSTSVSSTIHPRPMAPHVAWRTASNAQGDVFMLHQGASTEEVDIDHAAATPGASSYGGGGGGGFPTFGCGDGIVGNAITHIGPRNEVLTTPVPTGVLSVDMAVSSDARDLAVAIIQAGSADTAAPRPTVEFDATAAATSTPPSFITSGLPVAGFEHFGKDDSLTDDEMSSAGTSTVTLLAKTKSLDIDTSGQCAFGSNVVVLGQATALAFTVSGDLLVQSREPALLTIVPRAQWAPLVGAEQGQQQTNPPHVVTLGPERVTDTGHEIFHRDAGGGIACASCHAEGAEDGHTWTFSGIGARRTQPLHIGLEGTEPFHWSGDESNLGELMTDVFVGRMGGVLQSSARLSGLSKWLFRLKPPAAIERAESDAAVRGKVVFEADAGCASCHSGSKLTNNKSVDVGTGLVLQVPSLVGVGYRAPLMHTGCATTLEARFDPICGGSKHGAVAQLTTTQVSDLVSYLKTL